MTTTSINYGTNNQAITLTLDSLADGAFRQGTEIQNTSGFTEMWIGGTIDTGTGGNVDGYFVIYAAISADGGTTYSGGCTGSDAAYSVSGGVSDTNLIPIARIHVPSDAANTVEFCFPISPAFNGTIPDFFALVVENRTGATLGTVSNDLHYQGANYDTT